MRKGDNMENIYLKVPRLIHCFGNENNIDEVNKDIQTIDEF